MEKNKHRCGTEDIIPEKHVDVMNKMSEHLINGIEAGNYTMKNTDSNSDSNIETEKQKSVLIQLSNLIIPTTKIVIPIVFYINCPHSNPLTDVTESDLDDFIKTLNNNYENNVPIPQFYNADKFQSDFNKYLNLRSCVPITFKKQRIVYKTPLTITNDPNVTEMSEFDKLIKLEKTTSETNNYTVPESDINKTLNIWMVKFTNGMLGYAQFPWELKDKPFTDGVVLDYRTISSKFDSPPYIKNYQMNRTAVHEIGHWLGLYHVFNPEPYKDINGKTHGITDTNNDNLIDVDEDTGDCVKDTPSQIVPTYGNPLNEGATTWDMKGHHTHDNHLCMFMNYMNYTDDVAMFMFTKEQKAKIILMIDMYRSELKKLD